MTQSRSDRRFTIVSTEEARGDPQIYLDFKDNVRISVAFDNILNDWGRYKTIRNLDLEQLEAARKKLIVGLSQREELIRMISEEIAMRTITF
jgi:hypothetical protein